LELAEARAVIDMAGSLVDPLNLGFFEVPQGMAKLVEQKQ
jgi:hypothetical protein